MSDPATDVGSPPPPPRRRGGRIALALLLGGAVLVLAAALVASSRVESWARRAIETRASAALGGTVRVGSLELDLLDLRARFSDLTVTVPAPGAPPLRAGAAGGSVALAWSGLLDLPGGRYRIAEVRLDGPYLEASQEFLHAFKRPARAPSQAAWRLERLELRGGRLRFEDQEMPLSLVASDLDLRGVWAASRDAVSGELGLLCTVARPPFARPYPVEVRTGFRLKDIALDLYQMRARAPGLAADGALRIAFRDTVQVTGAAQVAGDLGVVRDWMTPEVPALEGQLTGSLVLDAHGGALTLQGPVEGHGVVVGTLRTTWLRARVSVRPGVVDFVQLRARAYGGALTGALSLELGEQIRFRTNLTGQALDAPALLELAQLPLPISASLDAGLSLAGAPADPGTWSGSGRLLARPRAAPGKVPIGATGEFDLQAGRLRVRGARVQAAEADLKLDLEAALGAHPVRGTLALEGSTRDAAATQAGALTLLTALDADPGDLARRPISGAGPVRVRAAFGGAPDVEVALSLADGAWSGHPFATAALDLALRGSELQIRRVAADGPEGRIDAGAVVSTRAGELRALQVQAQGAALSLLEEIVPLPVHPGGRVTGDLLLETREGDVLHGGGRLVLEGAELYGERIDHAEAQVAIEGSQWTFDPVMVSGPAGKVTGSARVQLEGGTAEFALDRVEVTLAGVQALRAAGLSLEGTIVLAGSVSLGANGPTGELHVQDVQGSVSGVALAPAKGRVDLFPDHLQISLASPEERTWRVQGTLNFTEDYEIDGVVELEDATFELPSTGTLTPWLLATGRVSVRGPLARPAALEAEGTVQRADIHVGTALLQAVSPIPLSLRDGRLQLEQIQLEGTGSRLEATATVDLNATTLEMRSKGSVDLGVISAFVEGVRASGALQADLVLAGPLTAPRLTGRFSMQGGRLRFVGFPQAFEGINLAAEVEDTKATLSTFTARLGGGEVQASGSATLTGFTPTQYMLKASGTRVRLTYPEGFTAVYSGNLTLEGTAEQSRLAGEVRLLRGVYSKDIELASLLGFGSREYAGSETELLPEDVFLDIDVKSDGNVWMRTRMIEVEAGLDLHLGGELTAPELTGRAELFEGGKLTFRDVEYVMRRGTLEFLDLERINPYIVLTADTHVEDYDITLHLEGTMDDFEYRLTSAPSLSQEDIISLLLTGQTLTELGESGQDVGTAATGDMAANYFAGALTGRFTGTIERAFGLERMRIDPLLVQGEADPTARVTVGKRVAEDLLLIYSTELGATERDVYKAEWQASRKYRITAESDEEGGTGGTVQYIDRFFWSGAPAAPAAAARGAVPADSPTVLAVEIEGELLGDEKELRRRLRLNVGEPYQRSGLFDGMERIRRWYVRRGRIQAEVDGVVEDVSGGVRLHYTVKPGPEVPLHIEGLGRRDRRNLRDRLNAYWVDSMYNEDLYRDSVDLARRYVQERGFYAADVQLEDRRAEGQGITLRVDTGHPVKVREVVIEGLQAVPEQRVRKQVLTKPDTAFNRGLLRAAVLEEDLLAIRNLMRDLGHLDATVDPPRVSLAADGREATLTIRVHEGIAYKVGTVSFSPDLPFSEEQLRGFTPLASGDVFSPSRVLSAQTALRNKIDALGYPDVRVRPRPQRRPGVVDVVFNVVPGAKKTLADIEVTGNRRTREKIVREQLELKEGQPLSREALLGAQHRLYRLGIFSNVRMETSPLTQASDGTAHLLRVRVEEAPPLDFNVGVGYDTEVGAKVNLGVTDNNVGGYDRRLGLQTRYSGKEKRVLLLGEEPRLFSRNVDLLATVQWEDTEETGFSNDQWSTAVRLEQKFKPKWTRYLRYNYQRNDVYDVEDPLELLEEERLTGDSRLGDIGFSMVRDSRDDPFLPTKGSQVIGEARMFAEPLVSDATFLKLSLRGSKVWTYANQVQFATSLRLGAAWTYAGTDVVPLAERFFAGGESTLRGFERDEAGPGTIEGDIPIGGEALVIANQELRVPLYKQLKGVMFYDLGNAFLEPSAISLDEVRDVVGAGLRVETPIGPIRVEYGHKLDRREGESAGEVFISIGNPF